MLVNKYGLSHVCAKQEFRQSRNNFFPYLDVSFDLTSSNDQIEFYFRGALDQNSTLKNLFEYLMLTSWNGYGFIFEYYFCSVL